MFTLVYVLCGIIRYNYIVWWFLFSAAGYLVRSLTGCVVFMWIHGIVHCLVFQWLNTLPLIWLGWSSTYPTAPWSWRMWIWVVRMSSCLYPFHWFVFHAATYLVSRTISTSLLVLTDTIFTPLVSIQFMECQLHIMKVKSSVLGTHESHAVQVLEHV